MIGYQRKLSARKCTSQHVETEHDGSRRSRDLEIGARCFLGKGKNMQQSRLKDLEQNVVGAEMRASTLAEHLEKNSVVRPSCDPDR